MDRMPVDDRSAMAQAMAWSSRIMTISLEMALPGVAGFWIDGKLGTEPVCVILGAAFGMTVGMIHLMQLAKTGTQGEPSPRENSQKKEGDA